MRDEQQMIAYALEIDPALLPHAPELLADFEELGSDAELIAEVIAGLGLPPTARVLDLGCGKGAMALEVAESLGFEVLGVELFAPFVAHCEAQAQARGLSDRVRFQRGDILKLVGTLPEADVVVFAALGDVLGRLDETVAVIRRFVRPGGFIVVSDVFVREGGSADFPGFERYVEREQTLVRLTACGDRLVQEHLSEDDDDEEDNDEEDHEADGRVAERAAAIAARAPELAEAVWAFARSQAAENAFITEQLIDAVWVLQRVEA